MLYNIHATANSGIWCMLYNIHATIYIVVWDMLYNIHATIYIVVWGMLYNIYDAAYIGVWGMLYTIHDAAILVFVTWCIYNTHKVTYCILLLLLFPGGVKLTLQRHTERKGVTISDVWYTYCISCVSYDTHIAYLISPRGEPG